MELHIEGYGSVFNTIDSYADTIRPGAFTRSLAEWRAKGQWPKLLLQHGGVTAEDMVPVGAWTDMRETSTGLKCVGHVFDVDADRARVTAAALTDHVLDGLSIGFRMRAYSIDQENGVRILTDVELWEVSIVTFPANDPARITTVEARSDEAVAVSRLLVAMQSRGNVWSDASQTSHPSQQRSVHMMERATMHPDEQRRRLAADPTLKRRMDRRAAAKDSEALFAAGMATFDDAKRKLDAYIAAGGK